MPQRVDVLAADVILLWTAPQPPALSLLDDMHAILTQLQQIETSCRPKRLILVSNLLTWGSSPLICPGHEASMGASEDDYLERRCWPTCEGLMALEAHVLRLNGQSVKSCVIAPGAIYGAGEESFFKMMNDAYNLTNPLVLPSRGENILPTVHVGVFCAFLCWLIDRPQHTFPKLYMLACEPKPSTLASIVDKVCAEWAIRAKIGAHTLPRVKRHESTQPPECMGSSRQRDHGEVNARAWRVHQFDDTLECCNISFNYPASIMLALDCAGLVVERGIFSKAIHSSKIHPFVSPDSKRHGLAGNTTEVIDEFVAAWGLSPYRICVFHLQAPQRHAPIAKFLSQRLQLKCIDIESSKNGSGSVPSKTVASCVRPCLLQQESEGYVLDACHAAPTILQHIFTGNELQNFAQSESQIVNALPPSHVVLSCAATEAYDENFDGASSREDEMETLVPALADLFGNRTQIVPLVIDHCSSSSGSPLESMLDAPWKLDLLNSIKGGRSMYKPHASPPPRASTRGFTIRHGKFASCTSQLSAVPPCRQLKGDSQTQHLELQYGSTRLRDFTMKAAMGHLTKAMLQIVSLPPGRDKVASMAELLLMKAQHIRLGAEAHVRLRFLSSLASLREIRKAEIGDNFE